MDTAHTKAAHDRAAAVIQALDERRLCVGCDVLVAPYHTQQIKKVNGQTVEETFFDCPGCGAHWFNMLVIGRWDSHTSAAE